MKKEYLAFLCCPECGKDLIIKEVTEEKSGKIMKGKLECTGCQKQYPIRLAVPRFVESSDYADSFGPQWKAFAKSQIDTPELQESALRFDTEMYWTTDEIKGKNIVEFGSGAGRFIDVVSKKSAALVVGLDITDAVDASQENLGDRENVFFI